MQSIIHWVAFGVVFALIGIYVWLKARTHKQEENEKSEIIKLLRAIAEKVDADKAEKLNDKK